MAPPINDGSAVLAVLAEFHTPIATSTVAHLTFYSNPQAWRLLHRLAGRGLVVDHGRTGAFHPRLWSLAAPPATRTCLRCGQAKLLEEFHRDKAGPGGFKRNCRACVKAADRKWSRARREVPRRRHGQRPMAA